MLEALNGTNKGVHIDLQSKVSNINENDAGLRIDVQQSDSDFGGESGSSNGGSDLSGGQSERADLTGEGKGLVIDISA